MRGHQQANQAAHAASAAAHRDTRQVLIPSVQGAAQAYTDAQDQALEERDLGRHREARRHVDRAVRSSEQYALELAQAVQVYAASLAASNRAQERADLRALEAATGRLVGFAMARADQGLAQVRSDAAEQAAISRALTAQMVAVAEQQARDLVLGPDGVAVQLQGQLAQGDQATLQAALAGAGALVSTVAVAVDAIQRSACMQRCQTLGGLGAELEAIELVPLLLSLAQLARSPRQASQLIVQAVGDLAGKGRALFQAVSRGA